MPVTVGSSDISNAYVGTAQLDRIYRGTELVYQRGMVPAGLPTPGKPVAFETQFINTVNVWLPPPPPNATHEVRFTDVAGVEPQSAAFIHYGGVNGYSRVPGTRWTVQARNTLGAEVSPWSVHSDPVEGHTAVQINARPFMPITNPPTIAFHPAADETIGGVLHRGIRATWPAVGTARYYTLWTERTIGTAATVFDTGRFFIGTSAVFSAGGGSSGDAVRVQAYTAAYPEGLYQSRYTTLRSNALRWTNP